MKHQCSLTLLVALAAAAGCMRVKTESEAKPIEIKPIHITMDVNLKIDKELDNKFQDDNAAKPGDFFKRTKALVDRGVAGIANRGLMEARDGATDDDKIDIAELNSRSMKRFAEIAKSSGVSLEAVQKRRAEKIREKLPAGAWYQNEAGEWLKK